MSRTKKKFTSVISLLLTASLVFNVSALNADPGPISDAETGSVQAELVSEITHMRGANERHFQASDGSYVALSYAEQIHYLDEDSGEWVEVDNTLKSIDVSSGKKVYKNRDGLFEVEFAEPSDTERDTVTISSEGNILSWEVAKYITPDFSMQTNASAELIRTPILSTAEMVIPVADFSLLSEEEHLTVAKKSASRAMYTDALGNGIDLVYDVSGNKVKESIIIDSFEENASYIAEITAEGLTAVLNEDGSVTFTDTDGETVFVVEAPYMFDSGMGSSSDIQVDLIENKTGGYILAYTPDEEWLENEDRVYPVTLDPTVAVFNDSVVNISGEDDVLQWNGSTQFTLSSNDSLLTVGHNGMYNFILIDYDSLPTLPNNCTVTKYEHILTVSFNNNLANITACRLKEEYETNSIINSAVVNAYELSTACTPTVSYAGAYAQVKFTYQGNTLNNFGIYDPTTGKIHCNGFFIADPRHQNYNSGDTSYYNQYATIYSSENTGYVTTISGLYARPYIQVSYTRGEPPEGVYILGNTGATLDSYVNKWLFEKVDNPQDTGITLEDNCYGPYYIRFYDQYGYYKVASNCTDGKGVSDNAAPVYLGRSGNNFTSFRVTGKTERPANPQNYYWYVRVNTTNTVYIYYIVNGVEKRFAVASGYTSVGQSNIYQALTLATANNTDTRQKWTLTISPTSTSFIWPLEYKASGSSSTYHITSLWGWRFLNFTGSYSYHRGIDILTRHVTTRDQNDEIIGPDALAIADGIVKEIITEETDPALYAIYGNYVVIEHKSMLDGCGGTYTSTYMHLYDFKVSVGQFVKQGQAIARTGDTGKTSGPHLHLQIERTYVESNNTIVTAAINPTYEYNTRDFRRITNNNVITEFEKGNPNPIYNITCYKDEGDYIGVNSDFVFTYHEPTRWVKSDAYKSSYNLDP